MICDRYAFSGIAFTSAKFQLNPSKAQDPSIQWISSPDQGLPLPDLVIFLNLPQDSIQHRLGFGEERYEKLEVQVKVQHQFQNVIQPIFKRLHPTKIWIEIDASGSIEEVSDRIWEVVEPLLRSEDDDQIGKLWIE